MKPLFTKVHETWLAMLMAGLMSRTENKTVLIDFSDILFRHFTWIETEMIRRGVSYDYNRSQVPVKVDTLHTLLHAVIGDLQEIKRQSLLLSNEALSQRIKHDLDYMIKTLEAMPDEKVKAFSMQRKLNGVELTQEATDALTIFLFEESYKEYELILIYNYLKAHSDDAFLHRIFNILIEESFFHFKRFGDLMAQMGILGVPRTVVKELYQVEDVVAFLQNGIQEEISAKEECKRLSDAVAKESEALADFFNFINHQEDYHIDLMKEAIAYYGQKVSDA